MADEIELKLAFPEREQRRFMRQALLRYAVARQTAQLLNVYYDTADLDLRRRGIALRLRRQGRTWLQTVKCEGQSAGGLSTRPEWEMPYAGFFDFSGISSAPVRKWLDRPHVRSRLSPVFETTFRRMSWRFEPAPGNLLLLTLDRGWIAAAGRHETISEVEVELGSGNIAHLFELAESLARDFTLVPALRSKAERGYRLFAAVPETPTKAQEVPLAANILPTAAFQRIAISCLEQVQANHTGALLQEDPEFIHQIRVGMRRLKAAVRLFHTELPVDFGAQLLTPLHSLMAPLGLARDCDVLLGEITAPVIKAMRGEPRLSTLAEQIGEKRHAAVAAAVAALNSPEYGQRMLHAIRVLHGIHLQEGTATPVASLADFASARLKQLHRRVLRRAAASSRDDPVSLHALRIAIKRLRYAVEFLGPLMPRRGPRNKPLRLLSSLQDTLGQLNDLANAGTLLMETAGDDPGLREAVSLIGGWHGLRHAALTAGIPSALAALRKIRLPRLE